MEFVRDTIARPNVGDKWLLDVDAAAAHVLRVHPRRERIGLIPIFDVLALIDHSSSTPDRIRSFST